MGVMKTIKHQGKTYRLPFADLFRPLNESERSRLEESIEKHGVRHPVIVYAGNLVIDGGNRLEIGAEFDLDVPIVDVGDYGAEAARELAITLNRDRRHLTPDEQQAARAERIERVAEKRAEGKSLRAIAEEEGVSAPQILADIKEAGVKGLTPEPDKVVGKDGKRQSSKKKEGSKKPGPKPKPEKEKSTVSPETVETEPKEEADPAADFVDSVEALCREMDQIVERAKALKSSKFSYSMHVDSAMAQVQAARKTLWQGRPAHVCPYCQGEGCKDGCKGTGRVNKTTYDIGKEAVGGVR